MTDRAFTPEELEAVRKWRDAGGYCSAAIGSDAAGGAIDALLARNPPPKPKIRPTREAVERYGEWADIELNLDEQSARDYLQAAADAGLLAPEWLEEDR